MTLWASQARVDLYDASHVTAAGLADFLFNATSATAGPFLGTVITGQQIEAQNNKGWLVATLPLSPYVGTPVYLVVRETDTQLLFDFGAPQQRKHACMHACISMQTPTPARVWCE